MREQVDDLGFSTEFELRLNEVVRIAGRNRKVGIRRGQRQYPLLHRSLGQHQPDLALVHRCFSIGRVVYLEDNVRPRWYQFGSPFRQNRGRRPGGKPNQELSIAHVAFVLGWDVGDTGLDAGQPLRPRLAYERNDVVNNRTRVRPNLRHLYPGVLLEVPRDQNVLVFHRAGRWNREGRRHLEHQVGIANIPAVYIFLWLGQVLRIAFRSAIFRPGDQRIDIALRQRAVIRKPPVVRIGKPRRHLPERNRFLDGGGERSHVLVTGQGHRSRLARPVTALAVFLQNWCDIPVVRGNVAGGGESGADGQESES